MKSPGATTDYTSSNDVPAVPPPPVPFTRRGFQEPGKPTTASAPAATASGNTREPYGAVVLLPLAVQATFRRKLIAIIALQLGAVALLVALLEFSSADWLDASIASSSKTAILLGVVLVALLAVLNWVRDKHPINWLVLALLTGVLAVGLAAADVALDSHIVLLNCAFTWVFVVGLVLTAAWTQPAHARYNCCDFGGMTFGWSPPLATSSTLETSSDSSGSRRDLASPFISGALSFLVACGVIAIVSAVAEDIGASRDALLVSLLAQLAVSCWFLFQIDSSHHRLTPDGYMGGVVYLYADVLVLLAVLGTVALLCASCAQGGDGGAIASAGASVWTPFYPTIGTTSQDNDEQV